MDSSANPTATLPDLLRAVGWERCCWPYPRITCVAARRLPVGARSSTADGARRVASGGTRAGCAGVASSTIIAAGIHRSFRAPLTKT
jgi:hypothetical protein